MTTIRFQADAVVDRTGHLGRELWFHNDVVSLDRPDDVERFETVGRPGFLVPGLHDAHVHLASITAATAGVSLDGASDLEEVSRRIARAGGGDIVAIGFDETAMAPNRLIDANALDAMVDDKAPADLGARMNLDARNPASKLRNPPAKEMPPRTP